VTLAVAAAAYEVSARLRYERWRASYDNEGWLSRLTVASRDPDLIWEYRPYGEAGGIATNRYGFRDADFATPAKPPGTRRIAFVGDSVTLGMGVAPRDTFVGRVGARAAAEGERVEALNFGVDGYNALQVEALVRTRVPPFQPDAIVYVMCLNDFDFSDSSGRKIRYFRRPRFFLPEEIERRWRALRGVEFHRHHFERHRAEVFDAIVSMQETARRHGAGFLVAIVPVFPEKGGGPDYFQRYPLADIHAAVARFAAAHGIRAQDLLADFRRQPPPPETYMIDLWHLSAAGHRVVADSLRLNLKEVAAIQ
jgi:lysophospholipase L1-like esterase